MTRKDYASVSAAVNSAWRGCDNADQRAAVRAVVACLSTRLAEDNERFDSLTFVAARLRSNDGWE